MWPTIRNIVMGGLGMGSTAIIERAAETHARTLFGTNSGPHTLRPLELVARSGLIVLEGIAGLTMADAADHDRLPVALGATGDGMAYAAGWHLIRLGIGQTVGNVDGIIA